MSVFDFKQDMMDRLDEAEAVAKKELQNTYTRLYAGRWVLIYPIKKNKQGIPFPVTQKRVMVNRITIAEKGYRLFIESDAGITYRVHPSHGIEIEVQDALKGSNSEG